jgi:hypothetical protein
MFFKKLFNKQMSRTKVLYDPKDYKYFVHPTLVGCAKSANITVVRTELRDFYDSKWCVITPQFTTIITRTDIETADMLLEEILNLPAITKEAIDKLDARDRIYYD